MQITCQKLENKGKTLMYFFSMSIYMKITPLLLKNKLYISNCTKSYFLFSNDDKIKL